ncbi:putative ATP-dependent RNA helicase DDX46 [Pseudolycoriella hygida]|uniref:Probable ATP-dependent RNA helicase DDX46 n=1 Tax=Pseudolycoriella hygida TaxID=35572 RepID=A0A9Q0S7W0_9DIPT|nr:putative ATP-dependent RNA helicase DDX46 [Pseudolycoriella hygida]
MRDRDRMDRRRSRNRSRSISPSERKRSRRSTSRGRETKDRRSPRRTSRPRDIPRRESSRGREIPRDRNERRERSRSRDRNKYGATSKPSRGRERSRSRDRIPRRDRSKERQKEPVKEKPKEEISNEIETFDLTTRVDKEEEQRRLELEMTKRRERIERWRAERKRKELENKKTDKSAPVTSAAKKWSLENESDDEEDVLREKDKEAEKGKVEQEPEEEIDPLDAFMQEVNKEVRKVNKINNPLVGATGGVLVVSGIAKKTVDTKKGEMMEQNQDGLEYSSEEEMEDIKDTAANLANKHKKELAKIDHSGVEYMPFRKDFYVEVPELAKMTQENVDAYKKELEDVQVKGKGCPKPIKTWAHCGVSKKEMDVLKKLGFEKPTPIQCQAIPAIMSGRDLIGIAKTGSGKTLAFILPMFRHILDQPHLEEGDGPVAIIMSPTRELCMQIGKDIKRFSKSLNLRAVCVYGGTGISEQIAELKRGAEVIVCTPGRMIDMLAANSGRVTNLRRVTYIVLDEADRMFDMGFEPQVMRIIDNIRPDRQTVMFSATFNRQMEALARRILKKPIEVQVGGRSVVCKEVDQNVAVLDEEAKFFKLLELLGHYQEHGSIIVFVDKQENADILLKDLMKASYSCMSLHGGIDQFDRDSTILDFKSGRVKLLIATSVAARGLDVKQLILVVNYDCPNHYEDYVHRCGRTGRAGKDGCAWTFLTPEQGRFAGDIIRALEQSGAKVPEDLQKLWESYKQAQEAEGKKVHTGGGFSGKGFKFDEQEAAAVKENKKLQKAALGLQDSDDDDDLENDIDQQIENMFAAKRNIKEIEAPIVPAPATINPNLPVASQTDKLELAKRLASRINIAKNLGFEAKGATQQAAEAILKGGPTQSLITAKTVAEQLAAKLNNKLNYQPKEEDESLAPGAESIFRKYEEELEINDFPQQARWKVTSKEALAQISEYSEAGLTVRGTYVPTGKNAPEGERKLYLAIESCSELSVQKAKREITRLIKEELLKLSTAHHVFNKGRYKVL